MKPVTQLLTQNDLRIVLLNAKHPLPQEFEWHEEAYRCWYHVWLKTFEELPDGPRDLRADGFNHQDEVAAIFWKKSCLGLVLFNYFDLRLASAREDGYFHNWDMKEVLRLARGGTVISANHFSLRPEYRHGFEGVSLKDVLMGLVMFRLKDSPATLLLGTTRVNRKMNQLSESWGAKILRTNVPSGYGDLVDLAVVPGVDWPKMSSHPHFAFVEQLWRTRLEPRKQGGLPHEFIKKAA